MFFIYRWDHLQIISWYNYHNRFIGLDVFTCFIMFLTWKYLPWILHNFALDFSNVLPSIFAPFILVIHLTIIKIYFFPFLNVLLFFLIMSNKLNLLHANVLILIFEYSDINFKISDVAYGFWVNSITPSVINDHSVLIVYYLEYFYPSA